MYDIIADTSTILSHFSEFSWIKLKDYQTKIEDIYKQQKTRMKNFFDTKYLNTSSNGKNKATYNIFYHLDSTKKICLEVLNRYFYNSINRHRDTPYATSKRRSKRML